MRLAEQLRQPTRLSPSTVAAAGSSLSSRAWIAPGVALLRLLRPHQWVKNLLLFAPLMLAHEVSNWAKTAHAVLAFALFSLCASAVYVLNDLIDLDADRRHPTKCKRPLAAGAVPIAVAVAVMVMLFAGSLAGAFWLLPFSFALLLGLYALITTAYSIWFKRALALDILVLAGLYAFRVFAGGAAVDVAVSEWLLVFCMFLFVSLALLKRYLELQMLVGHGQVQLSRRNYIAADLPMIENLGITCGCLSVLVLCLYLNSPARSPLYVNPRVLWLMGPVLLYWHLRLWLQARRGTLAADPIDFVLRDRVTYVVAGAAVVLFLAASHDWLGML